MEIDEKASQFKSKADGNAFKSMFVGMDVHKNYLHVAVLDEKATR